MPKKIAVYKNNEIQNILSNLNFLKIRLVTIAYDKKYNDEIIALLL